MEINIVIFEGAAKGTQGLTGPDIEEWKPTYDI